MAAHSLRIFISSPGDVGQERLLTERVIERLQGEFGDLVRLEPLLWEHEPLRATANFQEQIPPPSEADIVICILWSRLGTRLPEQFRRPDGTTYASGTEWEFEEAVRSYQERGKPEILVYRKTAEPLASLMDEKAVLQQLEQMRALDAFIDHWFGSPEASFRRAFHPFPSADHFEQLLETHLRRLIAGHLPKYLTGDDGMSGPVPWPPGKGSPYRGLQVFDVDHAPVFFGRTRAITEVRDRLVRQAAAERAFLLIFGMSGCGKSSLVRAGVLPTLTQPGVIEGIGLWRRCVFRPTGAAGDLCEGLALALLGPHGLPELEAAGLNGPELAALFREAPQRAVAPLRMGLKAAADASTAQEHLARPLEARLAVVVDQMEEIFTRESVDAGQREGFVAVLSALARSGLVWVIATMRSDFYPRCSEIPELVSLKGENGQYDLLPPSAGELRQMICQPAHAAGLRFEIEPLTGEGLDEVLHEAAASNPEALPLLEFTLDELFKQRAGEGVLTFGAYRQLGGLEGALAYRAEEVLTSVAPAMQAALPALLRALVTIGQGGVELVASHRVSLKSLQSNAAAAGLAEALIQARLLVTDLTDDGQAVVGVAHEALLRHWPRAQKCLAEDQEFLRARDRVGDAAARWHEEGKQSDFLLAAGKPLAEAEELLSQRRADLDARLVEFIEASRRQAARGRRRRRVLVAAVMAMILAFGVISNLQWQRLKDQQNHTVEAIANLSDVPQKVEDAKEGPQWKARVLDAIYQANKPTLEQAPDNDTTKRARAVNDQIQAESLLLKDKADDALNYIQKALRASLELAKARRIDPEQRKVNQRNLGIFYVKQGTILERLGRFDEQQQAYKEAQHYSQLAYDAGDAKARRCLWYAHILQADLLCRQQHLDEALAECQAAQRLIETGPPPDDPGDRPLTYHTLGQILQAWAGFYQEGGDRAREQEFRRRAQEAFAKAGSGR